MKSLWQEAEAARCGSDLALRAYTSRLLGADTTLVLHGGGNTSVKTEVDGIPTLHVKGTGSDLASVDEHAFTPLRLDAVQRLLQREQLDNTAMMRELDACLMRRPAPRPSIETLLHGGLPFRWVEHTHANTVLAAMNTTNIEAVHADVYGDLAPLVPYHHSGHALAHACIAVFEAQRTTRTIGLILAFHGVVAFGDDAHSSYDNMIELVTRAEDYLRARGAWDIPAVSPGTASASPAVAPALRTAIEAVAGVTMHLHTDRDGMCLAFARRPDLAQISQQGPATPQHAVYTKRVPLITRGIALPMTAAGEAGIAAEVQAYAARYRDYLDTHLGNAASVRMDAAPRIVLDPKFGLCAFGRSAREARIAAEMYRHDIAIITRASAHGAYRAAPAAAIAQAEYEYGGYAAIAS